MMERSESSDSDSNSSTSWVFVPDNASPVETNTNTFHLDCSREPIQELTEQDFVSASSESESDGISVISESDATNEECESKTFEATSDPTSHYEAIYDDISILKKVNTSLLVQVRRCLKGSNIVGVGVVLTAVFLGSYSLKRVAQNADDFCVNNDLENDDHSNFFNKNLESLDKNVEEIVDITIGCTYSNKESKVLKNSIKQCVKDKYERKELSSIDRKKNEFIKGDHSELSGIEKFAENKVDKNKSKKDKVGDFKNTKRFQKNYNSQKDSFPNPTLTDKKFHKPKPPKTFKEFKVKLAKKASIKHKPTSRENQIQSGEWYTNLHNARHHLRKRLNNDGYFVKKKNKWYFKWMDGRQELRRNNIYRPYSRNLNI